MIMSTDIVESDTELDTAPVAMLGTILIIEDDPRMQKVLRRIFVEERYNVVVAGDGQTGLDLFRTERPLAVVLDLILPCISGRELCQTFKSQANDIPVVVLSAISEVVDKVLLLELGADDYVTKPFSPREFDRSRPGSYPPSAQAGHEHYLPFLQSARSTLRAWLHGGMVSLSHLPHTNSSC